MEDNRDLTRPNQTFSLAFTLASSELAQTTEVAPYLHPYVELGLNDEAAQLPRYGRIVTLHDPEALSEKYSDSDPDEETDPSLVELTFLGIPQLPARSVTLNENKVLGQGAFGQVYKGQWGKHEVALKSLTLKHAKQTFPTMTPSQLKATLEWEVSRLATVSHPNCVQFYGVYQDQGKTYLAMEFCSGGTLQEVLKKQAVTWAQRWQWALEISQGLAYLHHQGILHRDLKADNILVDRHGCAKLADLGVSQVDALLQKEELEAVAEGVQDQRFIAPETLALGSISTQATDIYALGLVFWQLVSGQMPRYANLLGKEEKKRWMGGDPTYQREAIPETCPDSFRHLILACWQTDPTHRPTLASILTSLKEMGEDCHPDSGMMAVCIQLDTLIHPKRVDSLTYLAPYLTQYKVTQPIDMYWRQFEVSSEDNDLVEAHDKLTNPPIDLQKTLDDFLAQTQPSSLLLLGESGLGKTLCTYRLADKLLADWRLHVSDPTHNPAPPYLPLLVRPALKAWSHHHLQEGLTQVLDFYGLPTWSTHPVPLLLIIDGYDECQLDDLFYQTPQNLRETLGISGADPIKLLITCRPQTVEPSQLESRFGTSGCQDPHALLDVKYFLPFNINQLCHYLTDKLGWADEDKADYHAKLTASAQVSTVLRNPFVLTVMAQSWTTLMNNHADLTQLNRWKIYDSAVAHWITTQHTLISPRLKRTLTRHHPDLVLSFQAFAAQVAFEAFNVSSLALSLPAVKAFSSPWAWLDTYLKEDSQAAFVKRQARLTDKKKRRALLSEADYLQVMQGRLTQFLVGSPLKHRAGSIEFSHKSFFEYFTAKYLVLLRDKDNLMEIQEALRGLNQRALEEEPDILNFWVEGWAERETRVLTEPLFHTIASSRDDASMAQAASNAATLLAVAQVPFSDRDLSHVQIPGANLFGAICDHTSFRGANLQHVNLKTSFLSHTDLTNANLTGAFLGENPTLTFDNPVTCLASSGEGLVAVGIGPHLHLIQDKTGEGLFDSRATLTPGEKPISSLAFSPDSQQLAFSDGETLRLYDVATASVTLITPLSLPATNLVFSSDGHTLAWVDKIDPRALHGWDRVKGQASQVVCLDAPPQGVTCLALSPDNQQVAWGDEAGIVYLADRKSSHPPMLLKGHTQGVTCVTFNPMGGNLASGDGNDRTICVWDSTQGAHLTTIKVNANEVTCIAYSPDGKRLASGDSANSVYLLDMLTFKQVFELQSNHPSPGWRRIRGLVYSPEGKYLLSAGLETVNIWDISQKPRLDMPGHTHVINSVTFSLDGQTLASGSHDSTLRLWDMVSLTALAEIKGCAQGILHSVTFSPNEPLLAFGTGGDSKIRLFDSAHHAVLALLEGHRGTVTCVTFSPDGQRLASASNDTTIRVWHVPTLTCLAQLQAHTEQVTRVAFSPNGQTLVSGGEDGLICVWSLAPYELLTTQPQSYAVFSIAFSPEGHTFASANARGQVVLWDAFTYQPLATLKEKRTISSVAFQPKGTLLALGGQGRTVILWHPLTPKPIEQLQGPMTIYSIAFSPDGTKLAAGGDDCSIFVWASFPLESKKEEAKWRLIARFANTFRLVASFASIQGALLSESNAQVLEQYGANPREVPQVAYSDTPVIQDSDPSSQTTTAALADRPIEEAVEETSSHATSLSWDKKTSDKPTLAHNPHAFYQPAAPQEDKPILSATGLLPDQAPKGQGLGM